MTLPRRSVLKAVGAFASLPLGQFLFRSIAQAQGMSAPPLKFIGVYHPHGIAAECYNRRASETETAFDLNFADSALAPFDSPSAYGGRSFKNRLITFEGVDLAVAELSSTAGHGAATCLFTGSMTVGADHNAQNESLDQYLARKKGLGTGNRFPTLNIGVGSVGDVNADSIAHGPGGAMIRNQCDPLAVFDQVFGTMVNTDAAAAAAARRRSQSVIDYVRSDLNSLSGRLASAEKLKLDQHLSALRDIETRLNATNAIGCVAPARPRATGNTDPSLNFTKTLKYNGGEPYFDRITDLQVDLLALAMACDATRFATLRLDDPGKPTTIDGTPLPLDVHNEVAHTYSTSTPMTQSRLGRLNRYYYSKVARLLQRLDEGSILDSTLVMAGSDMGNPSLHSTRNIPLILAGGANGKLTFGRRIKANADCPPSNPYCTGAALGLTSHNKILVSVAHLFGDTAASFGTASDSSLNTGPWPGLVG
jgi:Protein of unknown function (DUF1552)